MQRRDVIKGMAGGAFALGLAGCQGTASGLQARQAPGDVDVDVIVVGAGLAGLAGVMVAPIFSVQSGMGDSVLIQTLVVIIVGGVGSIRGAFFAALIIGIVDTVGRAFLPVWMSALLDPSVAAAAGPAIASMLIYLLMAVVLAFKPAGLFPVQS